MKEQQPLRRALCLTQRYQALTTTDSRSGMVQNGVKLTRMGKPQGGFNTDTEITPDYLNRKMESMMHALYDSIEHQEKRMRNLEQQIFELKNGSSQTKK